MLSMESNVDSQKLRTGGNMGFAAAFLMYPEVQDLLPKLFPGRRT